MLGKQKCRILKQIRQRIADENDIPYVTRECHFQGECRGTCPRCESELRYLEQQLALRESMGKRVAVAALCASVAFGAAGCSPFGGRGGGSSGSGEPVDLEGYVAYEPAQTEEPQIEVTSGEVAWPEETEDLNKKREVTPPPEPEENVPIELTGDVYYPPEQGNG